MKEIEIMMSDGYEREGYPKMKVTVAVDGERILIRPEGYGDLCSRYGEGWPILFEVVEGRPRVVIWGDINEEEYTHIVELNIDALETSRRDEV